jgi:ABC-type glycerol-3-phosphate transport system substrate-binding protein
MKLTIAALAATLALAACSGTDQPANAGAADTDVALNADDLDANAGLANEFVPEAENGADLPLNAADNAL